MYPDPERVERTLRAYQSDPERRVFAWQVGNGVVCAAGLRVQGNQAEVLHIGTHPQQVGRGYGRALLRAGTEHLDLTQLVAETDDEAVAFYHRSGFEISDLGECGGHRRYRAVWLRERVKGISGS